MKKIILSGTIALSLMSNVAMAYNIESTYETFEAKRLQNAFPHTVSKDANLIIENKLTATDYSAILNALSKVQDNNLDLKNKILNTYTSYLQTSQFLFLKPDGNVVPSYEYKEGKFIPSNKTDIGAVAQYSIAFNEALENKDKFNTNDWYQNTSLNFAKEYALKTSKYALDNMYQEGKFFEDSSKSKISIKSMGSGLLVFNTLWNLETDTNHKEHLVATAKDIHKYIESTWSEQDNVFYFEKDNTNTTFSTSEFGLFLWGSKELSDILKESGHIKEAQEIINNTNKMLQKILVNNTAIKNEGIVRDINIEKGIVSVPQGKDEINMGRMNTFMYGLLKWNESEFIEEINVKENNIKLIRNLLVYSSEHYIDNYALIHDVKFSDVSIKNDAKETPYITWYVITADYLMENYKDKFSNKEIELIEKSIEKNYNFLINNILITGKKIDEKLGF